MDKAFDKGMTIVLNPSPMNEEIRKLPLEKVSIFLLNEIEGEELTGKREPEDILDELLARYPRARVVLTLGGKGSVYGDGEERIQQDIYEVEAVDTTAAGDTFTGYFISTLIRTGSCREALDMAARASALAVSRQGAAPPFPHWRKSGLLQAIYRKCKLYVFGWRMVWKNFGKRSKIYCRPGKARVRCLSCGGAVGDRGLYLPGASRI